METESIYVDVRVVKYKVPKAERAHYFPCDAYMVDGPKFADFTAEEFKSWIYILSMCARAKSAEVRLNVVHVRRNSRIRTSNFVSALKKLESLQVIEIKTELFTPLRGEKRRGEERRGEKINDKRGKSAKPEAPETEPASRTPSAEETATAELIPTGSGSAGEGGTPVSRCIADFVELWKDRYDGKYPLTGKDVGLIKNLVKSLGENRLSQLLYAYFKMPDAWITGRRHDLVTLNSNLSKVAAFADTGEFVTQTQVKQMDRTATTMSQIDRIKAGLV